MHPIDAERLFLLGLGLDEADGVEVAMALLDVFTQIILTTTTKNSIYLFSTGLVIIAAGNNFPPGTSPFLARYDISGSVVYYVRQNEIEIIIQAAC